MNIIKLIVEDCKSQREGIFAQGFWALMIYRFSHLRMKCPYKVIRVPWRVVNLILQKLVEIITGISLPESATLGRRLSIEHFGSIILHGNVVIGNDCLIRQGVTIGNQGIKDPAGAPCIGNNVEIGAGAKIIGRINIGNNVKVGANSVVIKDVPADCIAVGIPARNIKK